MEQKRHVQRIVEAVNCIMNIVISVTLQPKKQGMWNFSRVTEYCKLLNLYVSVLMYDI
jgi:hypothetical protein